MSIRILLVDDHQMFREGLRAILQRDPRLTVVGEASDGRVAVEKAIGPLAPDVVIMDIAMPELNGVDAARKILSANPKTKVIALSGHTDLRFVVAMLEAGASGYVLKEAAGDDILRAVLLVHRGGKYLSPEIVGPVVQDYLDQKAVFGQARTALAAREREVVQLLAEGKTSKEIATLLHLSIKTVETHRRNIMSKLNMRSIASLTKFG